MRANPIIPSVDFDADGVLAGRHDPCLTRPGHNLIVVGVITA